MLEIAKQASEMRDALSVVRSTGKSVGFVPTMGFLHEGHAALIREARSRSEYVVVSIFVNPLQFNNEDDLNQYPRDSERDRRLLHDLEVDLVYEPVNFYSANFQSAVSLEKLAKDYCGATRPGHFTGVATVLSALFNIVQPDIAVFGEKDYQQLRVVEQLVEDLYFPIEIVRGATVREPDGLAMSSRNARLSEAEREIASVIPKILTSASGKVAGTKSENLLSATCAEFEQAGIPLDYLSIVDPITLSPVEIARVGDRILFAGFVGEVRLIDNVIIT